MYVVQIQCPFIGTVTQKQQILSLEYFDFVLDLYLAREEMPMLLPLNDNDIRIVLRTELTRHYADELGTLILDEFGVGHGAARIDVVVINSRLKGFEIKSDQDTLERLPEQARFYNTVFDQIILVVGYRHAYEALQIAPNWWGVKLAGKLPDGSVEIAEARQPRDNPSLEALSLAELLWRDEALSVLEELHCADGVRSKPRVTIYRRLVEVMDIDRLRSVVCDKLKSRKAWRSDAELGQCDG